MGRTTHQLRCTAHHEAAHFVAWFELLSGGMLFVDSVSIEPGPGFIGKFEVDGGCLGLDVRAVDDAIVMIYAGREGHLQLTPDDVEAADRGAIGDEEEVAKLIVHSNGGDRETLRRRARQLVAEFWEDIVVLAEALLKHLTLTTDQARWIIEARRGDEYANEMVRELLGNTE